MTAGNTHQDHAAIVHLQALFRGYRSRKLHVDRVKSNLPWSPFLGSKPEAISAILDLANVSSEDLVLDLGSGDGRILLQAVQERKCRGIGIELDSALVAESRRHIRHHDLESRIDIVEMDWLEAPHKLLSQASVVTLFFLPHPKIAQFLRQHLARGSRVVTSVFEIPEWTAEKVLTTVPFLTHKGQSKVHLYIVP